MIKPERPGVLEDNDIFANAMLDQDQEGGTTVRRNRIANNGYEAIWVDEGGLGHVRRQRSARQQTWRLGIAADCAENVIRNDNQE